MQKSSTFAKCSNSHNFCKHTHTHIHSPRWNRANCNNFRVKRKSITANELVLVHTTGCVLSPWSSENFIQILTCYIYLFQIEFKIEFTSFLIKNDPKIDFWNETWDILMDNSCAKNLLQLIFSTRLGLGRRWAWYKPVIRPIYKAFEVELRIVIVKSRKRKCVMVASGPNSVIFASNLCPSFGIAQQKSTTVYLSIPSAILLEAIVSHNVSNREKQNRDCL